MPLQSSVNITVGGTGDHWVLQKQADKGFLNFTTSSNVLTAVDMFVRYNLFKSSTDFGAGATTVTPTDTGLTGVILLTGVDITAASGSDVEAWIDTQVNALSGDAPRGGTVV